MSGTDAGLVTADRVRLRDLPSRRTASVDDPLRDRIDPFHDNVFDAGASSEPFPIDNLRLKEARLPATLKMSPSAAVELLQSARHWTDVVVLLGAIHGWRGLMPQQAAALLDRPSLVSKRRPVFAAALAAGLIDLGVPRGQRMKPETLSDTTLWRAAPPQPFDNRLAPVLTGVERASVLGRQPWLKAPSYDRHMALSAELGLRAAEYLPWVGTVLGERFSGLATMGLDRPASLTVKQIETKAADLTIVRNDGLRIAVEITATTHGLQKKVDAWADVLLRNPLETSGLIVMFVDAARAGRNVRKELEDAFRSVRRKAPAASAHRLWDRLLLAAWCDWFPQAGVATTAFTSMTAQAMTEAGTAPWKPITLADYPFEPYDGWSPTAVIKNAAILGQTPAWLRRAANPPDPAALLLRRAGQTSGSLPQTAARSVPPRLTWPGLKPRQPVVPFTA